MKVNIYWYDNAGHSFEISSGASVLAEGTVFKSIGIVAQPPISGKLFPSADSTTNKVCSSYFGHACQVNRKRFALEELGM
jgi:pectin lyase